jgi:outer membrane murein-binding lipoprotein Lpp|tara:strand:- start:4417 stop:4644 length:228 start_codon:yes stop_codon:yes gene_type:complete
MSDDRQTELLLAIGRLEGKVDGLVSSHQNLEVDIRQLSKRVNTLEKEKSRMYGAGVVLALVGSGVMWLISMLKSP